MKKEKFQKKIHKNNHAIYFLRSYLGVKLFTIKSDGIEQLKNQMLVQFKNSKIQKFKIIIHMILTEQILNKKNRLHLLFTKTFFIGIMFTELTY